MSRSRHFQRGIYVMPTLFTVGNLFCGFSSIVQASLGHLEVAAALIVLAAVLDGFDGRIARMTGTSSLFGKEFDSLADIVSFGVAPALLAYHWALHPGRFGWILAFIYVVCAAMRLARFNIHASSADKRFFVGLPSPMAAGVLACIVYAVPDPPRSQWIAAGLLMLVLAMAVLMISRVRYRSFREFELRSRRSYINVLPIAAVLVAVALNPKAILLVICTGYVLSGPIRYLWSRNAPAAADAQAPAEVADEPALR